MTTNPPKPACRRAARREDAAAITEIYNQGIEDRIATFETEPRSVATSSRGSIVPTPSSRWSTHRARSSRLLSIRHRVLQPDQALALFVGLGLVAHRPQRQGGGYRLEGGFSDRDADHFHRSGGGSTVVMSMSRPCNSSPVAPVVVPAGDAVPRAPWSTQPFGDEQVRMPCHVEQVSVSPLTAGMLRASTATAAIRARMGQAPFRSWTTLSFSPVT